MRTRNILCSLICGVLLVTTGCATRTTQPAEPPPAPAETENNQPVQHQDQAQAVLNQLQTGNPEVAAEEDIGNAVLGTMTYSEYVSKFETDVEVADPLFTATDQVLVVGYDGPVDSSSMKWRKEAGPVPETVGAVVAMGTDGRIFSRYVFFVHDEESRSTQTSQVERVSSVADSLMPIG